jgi:hypothetical protein
MSIMPHSIFRNLATSSFRFLLPGFPCLTVILTSSCKKLISIAPNSPDQIVTSQVFADSADAEAAVIQLYTGFSFVVLNPEAGGYTVYPALSADELKNTASDNSLESECYNSDIPVTDPSLQSCWAVAYGSSSGGMYQANACITGIAASTGISAAEKNQLIGEAEVVRAFLYFNLVNWFGGVPLVTTNNYIINQSLPRATTAAIYNQMVSDLTDAQQRLTAAYPSAGRARPNVYTADALLAKLYLYMKDWKDAAAVSTMIINSGLYSLESNLNNVFLRGSNEAIWQVQSVYSSIQTTEGAIFVPQTTTSIPKFILTRFLLAAFEPGDQRQADWVSSSTLPSGDTAIIYYYPYKYKNGSANGSTTEDYMIFRLAEQYLIRAEAESASGDQADAIADLNTIRARAGLPAYTGPTDPNSMQNAILHERQTEMFCELGSRWFDLKRTGTVDSVMSAEKPATWPSDGHAALYPIPEGEIQDNVSLSQNPGF